MFSPDQFSLSDKMHCHPISQNCIAKIFSWNFYYLECLLLLKTILVAVSVALPLNRLLKSEQYADFWFKLYASRRCESSWYNASPLSEYQLPRCRKHPHCNIVAYFVISLCRSYQHPDIIRPSFKIEQIYIEMEYPQLYHKNFLRKIKTYARRCFLRKTFHPFY